MSTPTLYDWIGGYDSRIKLTQEFYRRVKRNNILQPVFKNMDDDHPQHVARFIGEVFGGPKLYSEQHVGHPEMIRHYLNKHLTEFQRREWISLLLDTYTDLNLPADPEFASALVGYLEWGTRLVVFNSQFGAEVYENAPMPKWGWGETGGRYIPTKGKQV